MQRYESFIAVYEYFAKNYFFLASNLEASILYLTINFGGHLVICQNRKLIVKIIHYNNKYIYLYYSDNKSVFRN